MLYKTTTVTAAPNKIALFNGDNFMYFYSYFLVICRLEKKFGVEKVSIKVFIR